MSKMKVEAMAGEHITAYIKRAMQVAEIVKEPIFCEFNDVPFIVTQRSDVEIVCDYWSNLFGNM